MVLDRTFSALVHAASANAISGIAAHVLLMPVTLLGDRGARQVRRAPPARPRVGLRALEGSARPVVGRLAPCSIATPC